MHASNWMARTGLQFSSVVVALTLTGCAELISPAGKRERALAIPAAQCDGASADERARRLLEDTALVTAEPLTVSRRTSKGQYETRLLGAELRYVARASVTAGHLQAEIECHQADVALGRVTGREPDPFVAEGEWLDIDADAAGSALRVRVLAAGREEASAIAARARALVAARKGPTK